MLYAADIHVNRKIFVRLFPGHQFLAVVAVHIAKEIPGGTSPLGHGVGLTLCRCAADRARGIDPLLNAGQR